MVGRRHIRAEMVAELALKDRLEFGEKEEGNGMSKGLG